MRKRNFMIAAASGIALTVGVSSAAFAAAANPTIFTACVAADGSIQIVDNDTTECTNGGRLITWNQKGEPGTDGAKGDQGLPGAKGDQGEQGLPGAKGDQGAQGLPGAQGDQGAPGLPGAQGDQGEQGLPGAQGATGAAGPAGAAGPVGPVGPIGPKGASGLAGPKGATGATGATGRALTVSSTAVTKLTPKAGAGGTYTLTLTCRAGKAIGAGYANAGSALLMGSDVNTTGQSWVLTFNKNPGTRATGHVLCAS
jgi:hypothetical protein